MYKKILKTAVVLSIGIFLTINVGCTTTWQQNPPQNEQGLIQKDPLSYGAVTSTVKKGETSQEEIVRLFGPPNITTLNADGLEVWVYDRISNTSEDHNWSEARRFSTFFGLETFSAKEGGGRTSSTRTLTVIINFDKNKRVSDFSTRATQF